MSSGISFNQFREIPSSTTVPDSMDMSQVGTGTESSTLSSMALKWGSSLLSCGLNVCKNHPVIATGVGVATIGGAITYKCLRSQASSLATTQQQQDAEKYVKGMGVEGSSGASLQPIKDILNSKTRKTIPNHDELSSLVSGAVKGTSGHIKSHLSAYALRGAHIAIQDNGALMKALAHSLTGTNTSKMTSKQAMKLLYNMGSDTPSTQYQT
jgi:hypothetical protein